MWRVGKESGNLRALGYAKADEGEYSQPGRHRAVLVELDLRTRFEKLYKFIDKVRIKPEESLVELNVELRQVLTCYPVGVHRFQQVLRLVGFYLQFHEIAVVVYPLHCRRADVDEQPEIFLTLPVGYLQQPVQP